MKIIIISILCWACDGFNPNLSEDSHNYTQNEMYLKLFDETGYPKQGDIPLLNRKVFKGNRVSIREHPYVVSIRRRVSHYCMGTLLTKNLVLTVAHPLTDVPITELSVVAGENYADRGTTLLTVVLIVIHELFDRYTLANDIAMLRIYEDLVYRGSMKSIGLVAPDMSLVGYRAFAVGWGRCDRTGRELCLPRTSRYFPGEKMDPMLRSVSYIINIPNYYCEGYKRNDVIMHPGMLCLGVAREEDPVCPCLAVPGAPLVVDARLAALQSWGFGCGYSYDLPLVHTSVQYFQPWLVHNIPILRNITKENLQRLFEATKASVLTEWLQNTRLVLPAQHSHPDRHIEPLSVDRDLAKLRGTIYDIRDFLYNGIYNKCKAKLYQKLRVKFSKNKKVRLYATVEPRLVSGGSFLALDDLNVIEAYNATDIISEVEDTGPLLTDIFDDQQHKHEHSDSSYEDY